MHAHDAGSFEAVWPRICEQIATAARASDLVVLPEGTVPGYVIGNVPVDSSVTERALADVQAIARRENAVVVYGSVRTENGTQYNSALVVERDGTLAGYADKQFLWHFDRRWFAQGSMRAPVRTSAGTLGVMICADGRIPTIARRLVDDGAELLVMPTAWVTSGRSADDLENVQADLLAAVRARENGVPFVAANKCGVERGSVLYCGKSQIVEAGGTVLALASQTQSQILRARIALGAGGVPRCTAARPAQPIAAHAANLRIAITPRANVEPALLEDLEADVAVGSDAGNDARLRALASAAVVADAQIADPGGLVPLRLLGARLIVWRTRDADAAWVRRLARARAVELRVFVVCIAPEREAFAVDPDGTVVCGTFGDFAVAAFAYAPARAEATLVAPGTDVVSGLEAAEAHVGV